MYRVAAAQEMLHRREMLLAKLRERGALAHGSELRSSVATPDKRLPANQRQKPTLGK